MRDHSEVHVKQNERKHIHIHDKLTKINEKRRWEEWDGRLCIDYEWTGGMAVANCLHRSRAGLVSP